MHATHPVLTNERENSSRQNRRKKGGLTEIGLKTGTQPFMLHGGGEGVRSLPFFEKSPFFSFCADGKRMYVVPFCLPSPHLTVRYGTAPTHAYVPPRNSISDFEPTLLSLLFLSENSQARYCTNGPLLSPFRKDKRKIETMYQIERRGARNAKIAKIPFPCPNSNFITAFSLHFPHRSEGDFIFHQERTEEEEQEET